MKKLFAIILLCLTLLPAAAQEVTEEYAAVPAAGHWDSRNEIGVSLLVGSGIQVSSCLVSFLATLFSSVTPNGTYVYIPVPIPLSVEYNRWLTDWLAIGGSVNVDMVSAMPLGYIGNFSILPDVKFSWYKGENLRLYSKLAVGYNVTAYKYKDGDVYRHGTAKNYSLSYVNLETPYAWMIVPPFGFQVDPICADFRTAMQHVDFFCEIGYGTLGLCKFGLKARF